MTSNDVILEIASDDVVYGLRIEPDAIVLVRRQQHGTSRWKRRASVRWDTEAKLFVSTGRTLSDVEGASLHALAMVVRHNPALCQHIAQHPTTR